ncbi:UNVERIFIED_CONTAM: hypothetical protein Sindi_2118500 [Sesamum indicum]
MRGLPAVHRPQIDCRMHQRPRDIISVFEMRGLTEIFTWRVKRDYPHPWWNISQIPEEHQLFCCLTGSTGTTSRCSRSSSCRQVSFCGSSSSTLGTSWPNRYGWPKRSDTSSNRWRGLRSASNRRTTNGAARGQRKSR